MTSYLLTRKIKGLSYSFPKVEDVGLATKTSKNWIKVHNNHFAWTIYKQQKTRKNVKGSNTSNNKF